MQINFLWVPPIPLCTLTIGYVCHRCVAWHRLSLPKMNYNGMAIVAQHIGHTMHNEIPLQWASCENGRGWYGQVSS